MPVASLLKLFTGRAPRGFAVPDGQLIYAIGDIHGRLDLLNELLVLIKADIPRRDATHTLIVFLGDLIDRGPDSRGVVERAMELQAKGWKARFLMGNHEEVFLRAYKGDLRAFRMLLRIGGKETLLSYGVGLDDYLNLETDDLCTLFQQRVPGEHVRFLSSFEDSIEVGDYLFVHAGIRPGVTIRQQSGADMRWIRDEFLRHREDHGKLVVHGHSVSGDIDVRANRIGIDTGAYASGRLTAIGLENDARWFLST
jgi:serine/threonine protein phosphatase 1